MDKFFNTTGPCNPEKHYMIDPLSRLKNARALIEKELYFMVHAPRQSRKTTLLEALAKQITAEGNYNCVARRYRRAATYYCTRYSPRFTAGTVMSSDNTYDDNVSYVRDLGLIAPELPIRIANPIYREVIVRVLTARSVRTQGVG